MAAESSVSLGQPTGAPLVRNLLVTTMINGVPTQVMMQVVSIADQQGALIDLPRENPLLQVLLDIRRELMIANELTADDLARTHDLSVNIEKEYRHDPAYNEKV